MDFTLIGNAASAIGAAKDIGRALIELRIDAAVAGTVSRLNEQLIKAQDALFAHQAQLLQMQQALFQAEEKLRLAEKMIADRGQYDLVEISPGILVYRAKRGPQIGEGQAMPVHYLCQPCFDAGRKAVLIRTETSFDLTHQCPLCKTHYLETRLPGPGIG